MQSFFFSLIRHGRTLGWTAVVFTAVTLCACRHEPPEEELLKKVEPVGSWLATLRMLGEKWAANSVPASFVETTVSAARKEFKKAAEETAKSAARPEVRAPIRQLVAQAETAGAGLLRAVEAGDRPGVARQVALLAGLHARFESLRAPPGEGAP